MTLVGSVVSKLVYAALLSVVLFATLVVGSLVRGSSGAGAMMSFLVMAALWWAVFLKREELVGLLSISPEGEGGSGALGKLAGLYASVRLGRALVGPLAHGGAGAGRLGAAGGAALAGGFAGTRADRTEATKRLARGQLDRRAQSRLDSRFAQAKELIKRQDARRTRRRELASKRSEAADEAAALRERIARAGSPGERVGLERKRGEALSREGRLATAERKIEDEIGGDAEAERSARRLVSEAEARAGERGARWGPREVSAAREAIRHEVNEPIASPTHAWRVGLSPEGYGALGGSAREAAHRKVEAELRGDRAAFGAIPDVPAGIVGASGARRYRKALRAEHGVDADRLVLAGARTVRRERRDRSRRLPPRGGISR